MSGKKRKKASEAVPVPQRLSFQERILKHWRNPVLRFLGIVILFIILFYVFYTTIYENYIEGPITHWNAVISNAILNLMGYNTTVQDANIIGVFSVNIKRGCDAIEPIALLCAIILAFPTKLKLKLQGILVGIVALLFLNIIRIVCLYLTGVYFPGIFDLMHLQVWQVLFILAALVYCAIWLRWNLRKSAHAVE